MIFRSTRRQISCDMKIPFDLILTSRTSPGIRTSTSAKTGKCCAVHATPPLERRDKLLITEHMPFTPRHFHHAIFTTTLGEETQTVMIAEQMSFTPPSYHPSPWKGVTNCIDYWAYAVHTTYQRHFQHSPWRETLYWLLSSEHMPFTPSHSPWKRVTNCTDYWAQFSWW